MLVQEKLVDQHQNQLQLKSNLHLYYIFIKTVTCLIQLEYGHGQEGDQLQKIQNRAGRVITGSSYDVRSADVLNNLK